MKVIAVAAIFSCLFVVSSGQLIVDCVGSRSTAVENCIQRSLDANNRNLIRATCMDCETTLIDYINGATCPDGSAEEIRAGKSRLTLHGIIIIPHNATSADIVYRML